MLFQFRSFGPDKEKQEYLVTSELFEMSIILSELKAMSCCWSFVRHCGLKMRRFNKH